jgi:lipopolysaccharide export LptBFGC system permease protein LptF
MRRAVLPRERKVKPKIRKFNPRKRFRFMLIWLSVLVVSLVVASFTVYDPQASYQAIFSIFSAIVSGVVFVLNYGRDIVVTILNSVSKNSLR